LPTGEFIESVNTLAKAEGFLLIIDDVRCGFRLNLSGSATYFGYHADLN
jgi:glutamate-1-semialdehyde 2,1-aminomutase